MLNNIIGIVGGDLRIAYLAELLASDGNCVYAYALEKYNFKNKNIVICNDLENIKISNKIITSMPLSRDNKTLIAQYSDKKIYIEEFFSKVKGKKIISGINKNEIINIADKYQIDIINLLDIEELAILNAIPTAEGAIEVAMRNSKITLHNSNCLVMGFGRIGKVLAKMLYGIGANVYCEARKSKDIAKIKAYNYEAIELENLKKYLYKFDFIFNTIPYLILSKEKLQKVKKECLIIDLASYPGGVDFETAKELGIEARLEMALPGRVAPKTTAKYIKDLILKIE